MSLKEVLQQCPKSADLYYQWAGQALKQLQKQFVDQIEEGVETSIPDIDKGVMKSYGDITLETNPRNLFSFFDQEGIFISVVYHKEKNLFDYDIAGDLEDEWYEDRLAAELAAFSQAFKLLEEKLQK